MDNLTVKKIQNAIDSSNDYDIILIKGIPKWICQIKFNKIQWSSIIIKSAKNGLLIEEYDDLSEFFKIFGNPT